VRRSLEARAHKGGFKKERWLSWAFKQVSSLETAAGTNVLKLTCLSSRPRFAGYASFSHSPEATFSTPSRCWLHCPDVGAIAAPHHRHNGRALRHPLLLLLLLLLLLHHPSHACNLLHSRRSPKQRRGPNPGRLLAALQLQQLHLLLQQRLLLELQGAHRLHLVDVCHEGGGAGCVR